MTYADYTYYAGIYMGSVSEEDFPRLAVRASSFLDYYTMGKAAAAAWYFIRSHGHSSNSISK